MPPPPFDNGDVDPVGMRIYQAQSEGLMHLIDPRSPDIGPRLTGPSGFRLPDPIRVPRPGNVDFGRPINEGFGPEQIKFSEILPPFDTDPNQELFDLSGTELNFIIKTQHQHTLVKGGGKATAPTTDVNEGNPFGKGLAANLKRKKPDPKTWTLSDILNLGLEELLKLLTDPRYQAIVFAILAIASKTKFENNEGWETPESYDKDRVQYLLDLLDGPDGILPYIDHLWNDYWDLVDSGPAVGEDYNTWKARKDAILNKIWFRECQRYAIEVELYRLGEDRFALIDPPNADPRAHPRKK